MQTALNLLGSTVVASYSVSCKVEQLVTQPFAAMGVTMATYCAQNRGINDLNRIQKGVKVANIMSGIYAVIIFGVVYQILPYAIRLFITEDIELVYGYAKTYIIICGVFFIPLGMIFIFRNSMQGCGYSFLPMMVGAMELVFRIAAAAASMALGSFLLAAACDPLAWIGAGVFSVLAYRSVIRRVEASPV